MKGLRQARGLSIGAAAVRAGVAKSTICQWERDLNVPRVVELEALLAALGAGAAEREAILYRLTAPRITAVLRASNPTHFTPLGDLILAMRSIASLSQERLGAALGVSPTLVSRWETGDSEPNLSRREDLLRLLEAPSVWRTAVLTGKAEAPTLSERLSEYDPPELSEVLPSLSVADDRTIDVLLLAVRAVATLRAPADEAWRSFLVEVLLLGASAHMGRGQEARLLRWSGEALFWAEGLPNPEPIRTSLRLLRSYAAARRIRDTAPGRRPKAARCTRHARDLLDLAQTAQGPDRAWALRAAGRSYGWAGDHVASLRLHRLAHDHASRCGPYHSLWATEYELGTALLASGDGEGAMEAFTTGALAGYASPDPQLALRWCESLLAMGERDEARKVWDRAESLFAEHDLPHRMSRQSAYRRAAFDPVLRRLLDPMDASELPFLAI